MESESFDFLSELIDFVTKHPIISILWVSALGYTVYYQIVLLKDGLKLLESREAVDMYNHDKAVMLDVRAEDEYRKGHLAGSVAVTSDDILSNRLSYVEKYKSKAVVVVGKDINDLSAYNCAKNLKKNGYQCFILKGGMDEWMAQNLPVVKS